MAKKTTIEREIEKERKAALVDNVSLLQNEIDNMMGQFDTPLDDLLGANDLLPDINLDIERYNYELDIDKTKIEAKETLECIANLYISEHKMKTKNINNIIKNDANQLSELNFTVFCAKKALISCMEQLDLGNNDPEMFQTVALFQKEMRDTVKQTYELQKKMKDFYKELKSELPELNNKSDDIEEDDAQADKLNVFDPKEINNIIDELKKAKEPDED